MAGNALDDRTVAKIFAIKQRPSFDPLIVHVPDWQSLENWVQNIPTVALQLAQQFMHGALTLLLEKKPFPVWSLRAHPWWPCGYRSSCAGIAAFASFFHWRRPVPIHWLHQSTRAEHVAHQWAI
ncbi:MAG: Sua5/YciO/YrdC/YwlC family protein [Haliscomenobacter sp.]|nr:Sua5/YciO/YrdC/YwlC family protein [Haliscomenobacter sp.]MBK9492667.1 Sua5/YciO/YrdC/YwlC family protein [Haliscomenobacter sp.]